MFDSLTAARQLTEAGIDRAHADAIANAIRQAAEHRERVTPTQLTAGLNALRAELNVFRIDLATEIAASEFRLTWRCACMMLAQTVATVGGLLVVLLLRG